MAFLNLTSMNNTLNCSNVSHTSCSTPADRRFNDSLSIAQYIRIVIFIVVLVLSTTGNGSIILVTILKVYFKKPISTFSFLITHLALTDFLLSINVLHLIASEFTHGERHQTVGMCIFWTMFRQIPFMASVGTVTLIAFERYRGIRSIMPRKWSYKRLMVALVPIWLISILIYVPHMLVLTVNDEHCFEKWSENTHRHIYSLFILFCVFLIPLLVIGICYKKSVVLLKSATRRCMRSFGESSLVIRRRKDEKRTIIILIAIVAGFAIFTLPNAVLFLYVDFSTTVNPCLQDIIHAFAVIMFFQTFFNPICYSILDKRFRADLKLLCTCACRPHQRNMQNVFVIHARGRLERGKEDGRNIGGETSEKKHVPPPENRL